MTTIRREWISVNGVSLMTKGWECLDISAVHDEADLRGDDVVIPGVAGVLPYRRWRTATVRSFPIEIHGDYDKDGVAYTDPQQGVTTNRRYLADNLGVASTTGDGTVTFVWHQPDGTELSAPVHVLGFRGSQLQNAAQILARLDLSFPTGIAEDGS